uniref:Uncharacterized protein n=1 Tax=Molossus molossus TaxID=27622 RepID=A0A7J8J1R7_MOLMO|nr:hypothetical protein HJG59_010436 [Molossus molossus]
MIPRGHARQEGESALVQMGHLGQPGNEAGPREQNTVSGEHPGRPQLSHRRAVEEPEPLALGHAEPLPAAAEPTPGIRKVLCTLKEPGVPWALGTGSLYQLRFDSGKNNFAPSSQGWSCLLPMDSQHSACRAGNAGSVQAPRAIPRLN